MTEARFQSSQPAGSGINLSGREEIVDLVGCACGGAAQRGILHVLLSETLLLGFEVSAHLQIFGIAHIAGVLLGLGPCRLRHPVPIEPLALMVFRSS